MKDINTYLERERWRWVSGLFINLPIINVYPDIRRQDNVVQLHHIINRDSQPILLRTKIFTGSDCHVDGDWLVQGKEAKPNSRRSIRTCIQWRGDRWSRTRKQCSGLPHGRRSSARLKTRKAATRLPVIFWQVLPALTQSRC